MQSLKYALCLTLFISSYSFSQINISGTIIDAKTKQVIPYCAVGIKNTVKGCLSNEDGVFKLTTVFPSDTLVISTISYKRKLITVSDFLKTEKIVLEFKENVLQEVVIYDKDNYLYEMIEKCRSNLILSKEITSKVYFNLSTEIENQPVELLECYYNATHRQSGIQTLGFKNGRVGVAPYKNRYFVSRNTSKAITFIDLLDNTHQFPLIPFQLGIKKLRKYFKLKVLNIYSENSLVYQIGFTSTNTKNEVFSGEAWIEQTTGQLIKLKLDAVNTNKHPFIALFPDGKIEHVSMQITKTFAPYNSTYVTNHIDFDYQFNYRVKDSVRVIKSKGVMFFYDYSNPFILPFFDYNAEMDDYRKITSLSYNEQFWISANGLLYSDKMKKELVYFNKNGQLINYANDGNRKTGIKNHSLFENNNLAWSKTKRIHLKTNGIKHDTLKTNNAYRYQLYKLKAQLFLDINDMADSTGHISVTILDIYQTFYNLPEEPYTNCFMNIYFDLIEIERRKMELEISKSNRRKKIVEEIYVQTLKKIEKIESAFFKSVDLGKNTRELKKYNELIVTELGINNFEALGYKP
jgi:hypothetical protein